MDCLASVSRANRADRRLPVIDPYKGLMGSCCRTTGAEISDEMASTPRPAHWRRRRGAPAGQGQRLQFRH
jgi:hypothetical protein